MATQLDMNNAAPAPLSALAENPLMLQPRARQLVTARDATPPNWETTLKPLKQTDAVQLISDPTAVKRPGASTRTPASHSANLESCATRPPPEPLDANRRPPPQARTSVSVTQRYLPFGM